MHDANVHVFMNHPHACQISLAVNITEQGCENYCEILQDLPNKICIMLQYSDVGQSIRKFPPSIVFLDGNMHDSRM